MSAVVCKALTKRYGPLLALDHLDLEIPEGCIFGLLGPNGAGKTTLLSILVGLRLASSGSCELGSGATPGYLDQDPRYYSWMTGRDVLRLAGELQGLSGPRLAAGIDEASELAGLGIALDRRIGGYSGGMRQRLGIAQAIVNRPDLLLLDEPVSSLDPAGRHEVLDVIASLRGRATVVVSSHILADVERVCDRVAILDHGRLIAQDRLARLLETHAAPVYDIELEGGERQVTPVVSSLRGAGWSVVNDASGLHIRMDGEAGPAALIRALATAGAPVTRLERRRPTLEEVFLSLTSHDEESRS